MKILTNEDQARRLVAYERSGNDADAAAALGLTSGAFRAWRKLNGLPARAQGKPSRPNGSREQIDIPARRLAVMARKLRTDRLETLRAILPR